MKSQQFKKKLSLNKRTVTNLRGNEMNALFGGIYSGGCPSIDIKCLITDYTCLTNCGTCDRTCAW